MAVNDDGVGTAGLGSGGGVPFARPDAARPRASGEDLSFLGGNRPGQARSYYLIALGTLIASIICLELQFLSGEVNFGNLIMVAGCAIAVALVLVSRVPGQPALRLVAQDRVYLPYIAFCGVSFYWSNAPTETLVQTGYLLALWAGCTFVSRVSAETVARYVVRAAVIVAVLSFAMIVVAPTLAFQPLSSTGLPELRGIFKHQLRLGAFESVAFALMVIAYLNGQAKTVIHPNRFVAAGMMFLITACMIAALARSYTAYMLLALPISIGLSRRGPVRVITIFLLVVLTAAILLNGEYLISLIAEGGGDVTLTGRTRIWEITMGIAETNWKHGHAYATFDTPNFDFLWNRYRPPHAHNSFIAAFFETGIVGVVLTAALVIVQLVSSMTSVDPAGGRPYSYGVFLVVMAFFASLTGVNYAGKPSVLFALTLLFVAVEARSSAQRPVVGLGARPVRRARRSLPI